MYEGKPVRYLIHLNNKSEEGKSQVDLPVLKKAEKAEERVIRHISDVIGVDSNVLISFLNSLELDGRSDQKLNDEISIKIREKEFDEFERIVSHEYDMILKKFKKMKFKGKYEEGLRIALKDCKHISMIMAKLALIFKRSDP